MTEFLEKLNEPQRQTLDQLRLTLFWSSHTNVMVRKDGSDHWFEADWLRDALDMLCGPHPEIERRKQEDMRINAETLARSGPEADASAQRSRT